MLHYLFLLLELFSQGRAPIETSRQGIENSAEECKDCHAPQYAEWRKSRHSLAWSNDFFQHDYKQNRRQWCRNCHIPLRAQQENTAVGRRLRSEGITCVTCHVRGDVFYAKSKRPDSPHNTVPSASFGNDKFCEGCHQFNFPVFDEHGNFENYSRQPMQNTVEQFRAGPFAKTHTCRDCHADTPGKHSYAGAHDLSMLKRALAFSACRSGDEIVTTLVNKGAGHNVPTGDVHRHIVVKAWRSNSPDSLKQAFYGRRFEPLASGGKRTIWDSTLPPNTYRQWRIDSASLGEDQGEAVNIQVVYLYGSQESYRPPFREAASQSIFRLRMPLAKMAVCKLDRR